MRTIPFVKAINEALAEEMRRDSRVFILGEDVGFYGSAFGATLGLIDEFGEERVRDTPLSEAAIIGTSIGAALAGMRPVAELMFMDFITCAMDQIVNQAAKTRYMFGGKAPIPLVIRTPEGSGIGFAAQHSQSFEAWFMHVPGIKIVIPSTPYEAKGLLKASIRDDNPVLFVEHKLLYRQKGPVPEEEYLLPLGQADIKRLGNDLTVISTSIQVQKCLKVADKLAKERGIELEVIDLRCLYPLDEKALRKSIRKTAAALIVHEACLTMGYGAEIAARLADAGSFYDLVIPIRRLGGADVPIPYNPNLEHRTIPQEEDIERVVLEMLEEKARKRSCP
jgi:pyruvate/2-oxoglutarate/acetoin dehydrogenase E1 component